MTDDYEGCHICQEDPGWVRVAGGFQACWLCRAEDHALAEMARRTSWLISERERPEDA